MRSRFAFRWGAVVATLAFALSATAVAFAAADPDPAATPVAADADSSVFHTSAPTVSASPAATMRIGTHEKALTVSALVNAKHAMQGGGMSGGGMLGSAAGAAMSLGALAAGPFGGMAASALGMLGLGRPHATMPSIRDTWALQGTKATLSVTDRSPALELTYAGIPGVDPDAYEPVLLKLATTSDNWRVVTQTDSRYSAGGMSAPAFSEQRVPVRVEQLAKGHVRVTPQAPLDPGEYAIALRPLKGSDQASGQPLGMSQMAIGRRTMGGGMEAAMQGPAAFNASTPLWQSAWDFEVEGSP